jgi:hypothetical protein
VKSTLGSGTTFTMILPVRPSVVPAVTPIAPPAPLVGRA